MYVVVLEEILCGPTGPRGSGTHKVSFSSLRRASRNLKILRSEKAEVDLEKERVRGHVGFRENEKNSHASVIALIARTKWAKNGRCATALAC